jgi:hypothetical protein
MVNKAIEIERKHIHAITVKTKTPESWKIENESEDVWFLGSEINRERMRERERENGLGLPLTATLTLENLFIYNLMIMIMAFP